MTIQSINYTAKDKRERPFDGDHERPVLIKSKHGWCSAWWNYDANAWVCMGGLFNRTTEQATHWCEEPMKEPAAG